MKILMFSNDYPPLLGGIAAHVQYLSRHVAQLGHEVHLLVPTTDLATNHQTRVVDGVTIHRVRYNDSKSSLVRAYRITRATLNTCGELTGSTDFDLIHQHDVRATKCAAARIARNKDIPLIWTYHSPHMWSSKDWLNHLFLRVIDFKAGGIITVSRELETQANQNWGSDHTDIIFIPNGVDTDLFDHGFSPTGLLTSKIDTHDFIIFCPSRFVPKKGIVHLSHALNMLFNRHEDLPLKAIFFKTSDYTQYEADYLQEIQTNLHEWIDKKIFFVNYQSHIKMPGFYAMSDLVVLPSLEEAVNLSMLEAMAMKKPVLASDIGGLRETIEHGISGWLVPPADPNALKEAIVELYQNRNLRDTIAENGHQMVSDRFSWDRIACETIDFYEKVLGQ